MSFRFEAKDFNAVFTIMDGERIANIANDKIMKWINSAPVVYGDIVDDDWVFSTDWVSTDTYMGYVLQIEPLKKESAEDHLRKIIKLLEEKPYGFLGELYNVAYDAKNLLGDGK